MHNLVIGHATNVVSQCSWFPKGYCTGYIGLEYLCEIAQFATEQAFRELSISFPKKPIYPLEKLDCTTAYVSPIARLFIR